MIQMVTQGRWDTDSPLLLLPRLETHMLYVLHQAGVSSLPELMHLAAKFGYERIAAILRPELEEREVEEVWAVIQRLPVIHLTMELGGQRLRPERQERISVNCDAAVTLSVTLRRVTKPGKEGTKVYAPKNSKPKDEGWVLLVGDPVNRELLALKRVGAVRGTNTVSLVLHPNTQGQVDYCLYLMSDSYLGLDQQYDLPLMVEGEQIYHSSDEEFPIP